MHVGPRLLPRRTALALGVAALAVSGCDDGDSPDPSGAPSSTPETDPDVTLVDAVLADLALAEQLALGAGLSALAALHRAHIEALDGPASGLPVTTSKKAARRGELRLQRTLVDAAMAAQSGALAQLFASMSAAVGQRLA